MVAIAGISYAEVTVSAYERRTEQAIRTTAARPPATARPPARLNARGRIAITGASMLLISMASVTAATAVRASHGGQGEGRRYVTQVEVRPGQNLWSIAQAYDQGADPRATIAEILRLNSLTGAQLQPGEELWVPRE